MLARSQRITKEADYNEVYRLGRSARGRLATCVAAGLPETTRVGVVASRRVGGAVERNRAKRRLRHAARELLQGLPREGWHIVLIATPATGTVDYGQLLDELRRMLAELGVYGSKSSPPAGI